MKKHSKVISIILSVLLCLTVVLLSYADIAHLSNHDHSAYSLEHTPVDEECQLCRIIAVQREILSMLSLSCFAGIIISVFIQRFVLANLSGCNEKKKYSLVDYKVKITA